jgi:hypothetical protein
MLAANAADFRWLDNHLHNHASAALTNIGLLITFQAVIELLQSSASSAQIPEWKADYLIQQIQKVYKH